jgi:hypothetical protein
MKTQRKTEDTLVYRASVGGRLTGWSRDEDKLQ